MKTVEKFEIGDLVGYDWGGAYKTIFGEDLGIVIEKDIKKSKRTRGQIIIYKVRWAETQAASIKQNWVGGHQIYRPTRV